MPGNERNPQQALVAARQSLKGGTLNISLVECDKPIEEDIANDESGLAVRERVLRLDLNIKWDIGEAGTGGGLKAGDLMKASDIHIVSALWRSLDRTKQAGSGRAKSQYGRPAEYGNENACCLSHTTFDLAITRITSNRPLPTSPALPHRRHFVHLVHSALFTRSSSFTAEIVIIVSRRIRSDRFGRD